MNISLLPSSATFHAIAYNERKVSSGDATLLLMENLPSIFQYGYTPSELTAYMQHYTYSRNDRIQKPQFHIAVSCRGHERSVQEILDFGLKYLEKMGYRNEGQPLIAYLHNDTDNVHIHFITSRINPAGKKIEHDNERRRTRLVISEIMSENPEQQIKDSLQVALSYQYKSLHQFKAILQSLGYESYEKDEEPDRIFFMRDGMTQGEVSRLLVLQHCMSEFPETLTKRTRQLKFIFDKYRQRCPDKDALTQLLRTQFGVSLIFIGQKDSPYGYFVVDHKEKAVYKGASVLSIKKLLTFKNPQTMAQDVSDYCLDLLKRGKKLDAKDLSQQLSRRFGVSYCSANGCVEWGRHKLDITIPPQLLERKPQHVIIPKNTSIARGVSSESNLKPVVNIPMGYNREWEIDKADLDEDYINVKR